MKITDTTRRREEIHPRLVQLFAGNMQGKGPSVVSIGAALKDEFGLIVTEAHAVVSLDQSGMRTAYVFELDVKRRPDDFRAFWEFGLDGTAREDAYVRSNMITAKRIHRCVTEAIREACQVPEGAPLPFTVMLPPYGLAEDEEVVYRVGGAHALLEYASRTT